MMRLSACLLISLVLLGCSGTETGNPSATSSLALVAQASDPSVAALGTGSGVRVASAWLEVSQITTSACGGTQQGEQVLASNFAVEVVSGAGNAPALAQTQAFCQVSVQAAAGGVPPTGAPAELASAAMVVSGTRADGVPFTITSSSTPAVSLLASSAIEPSRYAALLFAFDVSVWFSATDLQAVPLDAHGIALLDGVSHPATLGGFDTQVALSAALFEDTDENGQLDDSERTHPLAQP
ncbi:MAG TPA: hypothetical protein VGP93_02900 [Polyangiaceae bacterium]|jgi:hypothetical protein|nr:hypothetical protein [Polyangiaceae bacterium]